MRVVFGGTRLKRPLGQAGSARQVVTETILQINPLLWTACLSDKVESYDVLRSLRLTLVAAGAKAGLSQYRRLPGERERDLLYLPVLFYVNLICL